VENIAPLTAQITGALENDVIEFSPSAKLYDSGPQSVAAGNPFLKEVDSLRLLRTERQRMACVFPRISSEVRRIQRAYGFLLQRKRLPKGGLS
jgi:hypothetical protein